MKTIKFIKKTDLVIIAVILLLSAAIWLVYSAAEANRPVKAEIYYKSQLVKTVSLTKGQDLRFSIPQNEHVIFHLTKDGKICFEESDCPDKICVKTGKLYLAGQSAACLPNDIILKIVPEGQRNSDEPDIIIGQNP